MNGPPGEDTPGFKVRSGTAVDSSLCSVGRGESRHLLPGWLRSGLDGLDVKGDCEGSGLCGTGARVKRKRRGSIIQKARRETKQSVQPSGQRESVSMPTVESSLVIRPMRSSLGRTLRVLKIPSLLILTRQSPFGRPDSGVSDEASVVRCGEGGSL